MAKVEPAQQKWAQFDLNWKYGDQNIVRWSKKISLIERRYIFFCKKIKLVQSGSFSPFFILSPIMAKVEPAHQINTNSTEIDFLVTKTRFGDRKT